MNTLNNLLNSNDREILNPNEPIKWVPREPLKVLVPYLEEDKEVDKTSLEYRKEKATKIIQDYSDVITRCKQLETIIESRCKNVSISISGPNNLRVVEAIKRVFGVSADNISFEQYKQCIHALSEINNQLPSMVQ